MRIASLIPSATEILTRLGSDGELVAVTHRCAVPEGHSASVVTLDPFGDAQYSPKEIAVFLRMLGHASQEGMFAIDQERLAQANPDIIFMQGTCDVCAPGEDPEDSDVRRGLPASARVITLQPHSLGEALADIRSIGAAVGKAPEAEKLLSDLRRRMMTVLRAAAVAARGNRPRVVLLEWVDPPIAGGMWLPELVEAAGGYPALGVREQPGVQTPWNDIVAARPDVLILAVMGFTPDEAAGELPLLRKREEWPTLPAVESGRVYLLDGSRYFHRPTPDIIDSLELLAAVLHPEAFNESRYGDAIAPLSAEQLEPLAPI